MSDATLYPETHRLHSNNGHNPPPRFGGRNPLIRAQRVGLGYIGINQGRGVGFAVVGQRVRYSEDSETFVALTGGGV